MAAALGANRENSSKSYNGMSWYINLKEWVIIGIGNTQSKSNHNEEVLLTETADTLLSLAQCAAFRTADFAGQDVFDPSHCEHP